MLFLYHKIILYQRVKLLISPAKYTPKIINDRHCQTRGRALSSSRVIDCCCDGRRFEPHQLLLLVNGYLEKSGGGRGG